MGMALAKEEYQNCFCSISNPIVTLYFNSNSYANSIILFLTGVSTFYSIRTNKSKSKNFSSSPLAFEP
jgi:hypothetical protein